MIRIRKTDEWARKNTKLGTSSNFEAVYQRKFEPNRKVMALTFGTGRNRTLSWLLEDDSGTPPPKPLYLEHELKGCAPAFCRPICGGWPEPCCFPGCCPGKGCLPGCFPCCGCGPDGRCCYGGDMCKHTCPTGGLVPLEDEVGKRIEDVQTAKYEDFRRVIAKTHSLSQTSISPHSLTRSSHRSLIHAIFPSIPHSCDLPIDPSFMRSFHRSLIHAIFPSIPHSCDLPIISWAYPCGFIDLSWHRSIVTRQNILAAARGKFLLR